MKTLVADLWHGRVPLARAFWEFAIIYGSITNIVTTLAAFALFANDFHPALGLSVFFLPLPYNLLMVVAVWRSAGQYFGPAMWAVLARALILAWAVIATFA